MGIRLATDNPRLVAVAEEDSSASKEAFCGLRKKLLPGHILVATWTKAQSGITRSYPIPDAEALSFVVNGVLRGKCQNLRFVARPPDQAPRGDQAYRDLFLAV